MFWSKLWCIFCKNMSLYRLVICWLCVLILGYIRTVNFIKYISVRVVITMIFIKTIRTRIMPLCYVLLVWTNWSKKNHIWYSSQVYLSWARPIWSHVYMLFTFCDVFLTIALNTLLAHVSQLVILSTYLSRPHSRVIWRELHSISSQTLYTSAPTPTPT